MRFKEVYMEDIQIDWLVVVIGTILNMLIGFFWYSKWIFGTAWLKLAEVSERHMKENKRPMIYAPIVSFITVFFLALFEGFLGITTVSDGMFVGFCFWMGFVATTQISTVIWLRRPLHLFFIDTGYKLLSYVAIGGLIGA